jgi:hypothetical protein
MFTRIFENSKFSTKIEIILVFVQNKRVLEIQVIPWKGNRTPRKPGKKKHHEVTPKLSFI